MERNNYLYNVTIRISSNTRIPLFTLYCYAFVIYIIIFPFNIPGLFQVISLVIYLITAVFCYNGLRNKANSIDNILFTVCVFTVLSALIMSSARITGDAIQSIVSFLLLVSVFYSHRDSECGAYEISVLRKSAWVIAVFLSVYSFFPSAYYYPGSTVRCPYLLLGLNNSNYAGIVVFLIFTILWVTRSSTSFFLFHYLLLTYVFYMIYLTNSRTCIITAVIVVVYSLFFSNKKIPKIVIWIAILMPFVFVPIYLYFNELISNSLEIMGKRLFSGRQDVYNYYLSIMNSSQLWIFGNMSALMFQNIGNGPLSIVCSAGLVTAIPFYLINFRNIFAANEKASSRTARTAIVGLLSISVHSCSESSMVLGGFVSVFFYYSLFLLTHYSDESNSIQ